MWMHCELIAAIFGSAFREPSKPGPALSHTANKSYQKKNGDREEIVWTQTFQKVQGIVE